MTTSAVWDTASVASLYTTEPSLSSPPKPKCNRISTKGAFLAVLTTQKLPFRKRFQQPDQDTCPPPVMPQRKAQPLATTSVRTLATGTKHTMHKKRLQKPDSPVEAPAKPKSTRQALSKQLEPRFTLPIKTEPTVKRCQPSAMRPTYTASLYRSQPRVDRYQSLLTKPNIQQSAFQPTYYRTTIQYNGNEEERDPPLTPRSSNASRKVIIEDGQPCNDQASMETPRINNSNRKMFHQATPTATASTTSTTSTRPFGKHNTSRLLLLNDNNNNNNNMTIPPPPPSLPDTTDSSCSTGSWGSSSSSSPLGVPPNMLIVGELYR